MRRKESSFGEKALKDRRFIVISAVLVILILLTFLINRSIKPISFELAKAYASESVLEIINESVRDYFDGEKVEYSDLVRLRFAPSGMVTAIEYDSAAINRVKIGCSERLAERLKKFKTAKIKVPAGSLFGDMSLSGEGPSVTVKVAVKAVPSVELMSSLDGAGVNQSRHEIIMRVTADVSMIIPPRTESYSVIQDFVLAQTVIAGEVPQGSIVIE